MNKFNLKFLIFLDIQFCYKFFGDGGHLYSVNADINASYNYYKSLIVSYEKSIDKEIKKLRNIESKYYCYKCGGFDTCALNQDGFLVDPKESKIICQNCAEKKRIKGYEVAW